MEWLNLRAYIVVSCSAGNKNRVPQCLPSKNPEKRALACKPSLLLADEPTGNLDARNSDRLVELLFSLTKQENMAVVLATHNRELAGKAEKIYCMENGTLSNITGDFGIRKIG